MLENVLLAKFMSLSNLQGVQDLYPKAMHR